MCDYAWYLIPCMAKLDSGYERFSLVWKSNCISQPKMQQPNLAYTDNPQNICKGITCLHLLQLWSAFVVTHSQMFWAAASWVASLPYQSKPLPLSLQLVCNQGIHSVVKTANLFLQYNQPLGVRVWLLWISHGISCYVVVVRLYTTCMRMTCVGAWNVVEFQSTSKQSTTELQGSRSTSSSSLDHRLTTITISVIIQSIEAESGQDQRENW